MISTEDWKIVGETKVSHGEWANVKTYGANDVLEGVAIMKHEGVEVSITGNPPTPPASSTWWPAHRKVDGRKRQEVRHGTPAAATPAP